VLKRPFDVCCAAITLLLAAPLLVLIAVLIRVKLGSPILFRQERPGLNGRPFSMIKFRTMIDAKNPDGSARSDAERLTRFGRFLRSTSLDELTELWNVLVGDMSLVGPRPLLMQYLPRYSATEFRRHEVRPGITGWAQVHGRNSLTWAEKFALDVWYVDHRSFALDIHILCLTVLRVVRRSDISADGEATMSEFMGND
jgi:sugar transferase EpsL